MRSRRLILFARYPEPGRVKTRLIPALGVDGAAKLHRRLVLRTLHTAVAASEETGADLEVRFAGGDRERMQHWLGSRIHCREQTGDDLGSRMDHAFADSFNEGSTATVIIGSDCPKLAPDHVAAAFEKLREVPLVLGPALDGGYYLVGLTHPAPQLFRGIQWGSDSVLAESLRAASNSGLRHELLPQLCDLDVPEDLPAWNQLTLAEAASNRISVIIPALNEATRIEATIQSAFAGQPHEMIVVDGGSADDTASVAQAAGARVIRNLPGRAAQMNAGAALASGEVLMFLHADTVLPEAWSGPVQRALQEPGVVGGAFRFQIAGSFPGKRLVEWMTNLRSHRLQLPYGDQAIFMRRAQFEELGGFANLPIMEDYEFIRRLRASGRIVILNEAVTTSGRRWEGIGLVRTTFINRLMLAGYHLGVHPQRLAALYRSQRRVGVKP